MTVEEYICQLTRVPEYAISWYEITDTTIRLLVTKRTPAQAEIPSTLFGRDVVIRTMLAVR